MPEHSTLVLSTEGKQLKQDMLYFPDPWKSPDVRDDAGIQIGFFLQIMLEYTLAKVDIFLASSAFCDFS